MRGLVAYHTQAMIAAPEGPGGQETRDHHHRMLYALRELEGDLSARISAADEIEKMGEEPEEDDI